MSNTPQEVTDVATWKAKAEGTSLPLPSGNVALVRRPGLQAFLQQGVIPNSLLGLVTNAMGQGRKVGEDDVELDRQELQRLMEDPGKLMEMFSLVDTVCCQVVVQPPVHPLPNPEDPDETKRVKSPDLLYVDEVDFDDKMFIFNFAAGGPADLEQFREQTSAAMASLSTGADVAHSPERSAENPG